MNTADLFDSILKDDYCRKLKISTYLAGYKPFKLWSDFYSIDDGGRNNSDTWYAEILIDDWSHFKDEHLARVMNKKYVRGDVKKLYGNIN